MRTATAAGNLTATDVGITPTEIRIGVIADTGSPLAPGLFQGAVDGVQAWAEVHEREGEAASPAARSSSTPTTRSSPPTTPATRSSRRAARTSPIVGTSALFVNNIDDLVGCKDTKGAATGLPDFPIVTTEVVHQCSPVSYGDQPAGHRLRDQGPAPADLPRQPGRDELVPQEVRQERAARALPVPVRPEVGEELAGPGVHRAAEGGHQAGRHLRRVGAGAAERVHALRAGDEGQRRHVRPARRERRRRRSRSGRKRRSRA